MRETSCSPRSQTPNPFHGFRSQNFGQAHKRFHRCTWLKIILPFLSRIARDTREHFQKITIIHTPFIDIIKSLCTSTYEDVLRLKIRNRCNSKHLLKCRNVLNVLRYWDFWHVNWRCRFITVQRSTKHFPKTYKLRKTNFPKMRCVNL